MMDDSQSQSGTGAKSVGAWKIVRIRSLENGEQEIQELPEELSGLVDWYLSSEPDNDKPGGLQKEIKELMKYCQLSEPNSMLPIHKFLGEVYNIKKADPLPNLAEQFSDQHELNCVVQADDDYISTGLLDYMTDGDLFSNISNNSNPFLSDACMSEVPEDSKSMELVPYKKGVTTTRPTKFRTPSPLPSASAYKFNGFMKSYRRKGKTAKTCRILEDLYQTSPKVEPLCHDETNSTPTELAVAIPRKSPASSTIGSPISKRTRRGVPKSHLVKTAKKEQIPCPFAHEGCPKSYTCKNGLKYHLTHHHLTPEQEEEQKQKLQNPRYICEYPLCVKKYMNKSGLSYHQRTFDHHKLAVDYVKKEIGEHKMLERVDRSSIPWKAYIKYEPTEV